MSVEHTIFVYERDGEVSCHYLEDGLTERKAVDGWARYFKAYKELVKANKGIRRLKAKLDRGIAQHKAEKLVAWHDDENRRHCHCCHGAGEIKSAVTGIPDVPKCPICGGVGRLWCAMCGKWGDHGSGMHDEGREGVLNLLKLSQPTEQ